MSENTLIELLYGKGAHANPLACIEDLSAELAIARLEKLPHSIWQLVGHLNYWMEYDVGRMQGQTQKYPHHARESWPENPDGDRDHPTRPIKPLTQGSFFPLFS